MTQSASKEIVLYLNTADAIMDDQGDYTFTLQRGITGSRSIQLIFYNIMCVP